MSNTAPKTVSKTLSAVPSHELIAIVTKSFTRHINRAFETSARLMDDVKRYLAVITLAGKTVTDQDLLNAEALMNFAFKVTRYAAKIVESTRLGEAFEKALNESNKTIETAWSIIDTIGSDISKAEKIVQDSHAYLLPDLITTNIWEMRNTVAGAISDHDLAFTPIASDTDKETTISYIKAFGPDNGFDAFDLRGECVANTN